MSDLLVSLENAEINRISDNLNKRHQLWNGSVAIGMNESISFRFFCYFTLTLDTVVMGNQIPFINGQLIKITKTQEFHITAHLFMNAQNVKSKIGKLV